MYIIYIIYSAFCIVQLIILALGGSTLRANVAGRIESVQLSQHFHYYSRSPCYLTGCELGVARLASPDA